ncbi:MAG: hypothetical protein ACK2T0_02095 [Anaerolineales bacterium]
MRTKHLHRIRWIALAAAFAVLACNLPAAVLPKGATQTVAAIKPQQAPTVVPDTAEPATEAPPSATATITHVDLPQASPATGKLIYDVVSQDTAPEKRAPYGDSYDINRLERPFLQDMTYVPDLDIATFTVAQDDTWWYVSIGLVGADPNNAMGISYGVELDTDHEGFGDYLVWGNPPYSSDWQASPVQVFQDTNHDTGGRSAEKADAPISTDGYDALIFDGGIGEDPDLAWVRIVEGSQATVQFAFKKSWSGTVFMLGVVADGGLKDARQLDYVDRFTAEEAGSPIRANSEYPLKALFAVDNVCRAPFGFDPTGYEPQLCPSTEPPPTKRVRTPSAPEEDTPEAPPSFLCLPSGSLIDTPLGARAIEGIQVGDAVWSANAAGEKFVATTLNVARVPVPPGHQIVHVVLADGRSVWASPGHPTADNREFSQLQVGAILDGSRITRVDSVASDEPATYDLLPSGATGYYWANGVLVGSTLKQ